MDTVIWEWELISNSPPTGYLLPLLIRPAPGGKEGTGFFTH